MKRKKTSMYGLAKVQK